MIKSFFLIPFLAFTSSSCKNFDKRQQTKKDLIPKSTFSDTTKLQHYPDSFFLVSSGQMSPFKTVNIGNIKFQLVKGSKGDTTFIGTWDKSFQTPEGYKLGMSLQQIKKIYRDKLREEPGWGYYIELPTKWCLKFIVGQTTTDHAPTDTNKVVYIFKRN